MWLQYVKQKVCTFFYRKPVYKKLDRLRPKNKEPERALFQNLWNSKKLYRKRNFFSNLSQKCQKITKIKKILRKF